MTASAINELRVTEFSLAMMEGSGWYQVDYSMAEPITYGKGKGCAFLDNRCIVPGTVAGTYQASFDEFCSPLESTACSSTYRGFGYCGTTSALTDIDNTLNPNFNYWGNNTVVNDVFSDNCPRIEMYSNRDCEDNTLQMTWAKMLVKTDEYWGQGAKCFKGTLYNSNQQYTGKVTHCFKPKVNLFANYLLNKIVYFTGKWCMEYRSDCRSF